MMNDMAPPSTYLGRYAGFVTRLSAFVIDRFVIGLVMFLIAVSVDFVLNAFQINQYLFFDKIPTQVGVLVGVGVDVGVLVGVAGGWGLPGLSLAADAKLVVTPKV